jgi:NADPH-dependent curcumin reductase CurA
LASDFTPAGITDCVRFCAAEPKSGEVIFISGAAGAVGSTVVQLAKLKGMTVIASGYVSEFPTFIYEIADLMRSEKIKLCETVRESLEMFPARSSRCPWAATRARCSSGYDT